MSRPTVEDRLAAMERRLTDRLAIIELQLTELKDQVGKVNEKDWRRTIGMFAGDEGMKEFFEEGRKIREADREKARKAEQKRKQRARV